MGAVLGVFSLASWVSSGSGVSVGRVIWGRPIGTPQSQTPWGFGRELGGRSLGWREYRGCRPITVMPPSPSRDQAARLPGFWGNVGGRVVIVYNFDCPAPARLPAPGFLWSWSLDRGMRVPGRGRSASFPSTFIRWRRLILGGLSDIFIP